LGFVLAAFVRDKRQEKADDGSENQAAQRRGPGGDHRIDIAVYFVGDEEYTVDLGTCDFSGDGNADLTFMHGDLLCLGQPDASIGDFNSMGVHFADAAMLDCHLFGPHLLNAALHHMDRGGFYGLGAALLDVNLLCGNAFLNGDGGR